MQKGFTRLVDIFFLCVSENRCAIRRAIRRHLDNYVYLQLSLQKFEAMDCAQNIKAKQPRILDDEAQIKILDNVAMCPTTHNSKTIISNEMNRFGKYCNRTSFFFTKCVFFKN